MAWPRDDAKLDRVRAAMDEQGVDAIVARAPDNVLYLTSDRRGRLGHAAQSQCTIGARRGDSAIMTGL